MRIVLTLALRSKRDVLLARQRARQTAVLFHFEPHDQACIAAGAFAVATEALRRSKSGQLWIQIEDGTLRIFSREGGAKPSAPSLKDQNERGLGVVSLQLLKPLPPAAAEFSAEDLSWIMTQLDQLTHFNMFEEIERQNHEMLALLHALRDARGEVGPDGYGTRTAA